MASMLLSDGYNYDSTAIRLRYEDSIIYVTTVWRYGNSIIIIIMPQPLG